LIGFRGLVRRSLGSMNYLISGKNGGRILLFHRCP
jgi:hypothetical protein